MFCETGKKTKCLEVSLIIIIRLWNRVFVTDRKRWKSAIVGRSGGNKAQRYRPSYTLCTDRRGGVVRIITSTCTALICHYYYYRRRPMTGGSEISSIRFDRTVVYKHKSRANIAEPWQSWRSATALWVRAHNSLPRFHRFLTFLLVLFLTRVSKARS